MERLIGTVARGVRLPVIKTGDDLSSIVADAVLAAVESESVRLMDRDVIGITESIVARAQGNYATLPQIAADVREKFPGGVVGVVFPILSRNRFSMLLQGIAMGAERVIIQLSYPADEVGNHLVSLDMLDQSGLDPYKDTLDEAQYRRYFGSENVHPFTGIDYVAYYKSLASNIECIFSNDPRAILAYTKDVIAADIHLRKRTCRILREAGATNVRSLDELLTKPVQGSGYHELYGLLGSNKATDTTIKLFPRDGQTLVDEVQRRILEKTGKRVEVMIYGDGAFKDPVGGIWELADPVVSPAFTDGLVGTPNELKFKYLADNQLSGLAGKEAEKAMVEFIRHKQDSNGQGAVTLGTTPRRLTDLIGSLCDLMSGSGDKGTPVVLVQGYFDNFAS